MAEKRTLDVCFSSEDGIVVVPMETQVKLTEDLVGFRGEENF